MDEVKDNLIVWNKLKGVARSKHSGLPVGHPIRKQNKSPNHEEDGEGISTAEALSKLQKLTNVSQFETK